MSLCRAAVIVACAAKQQSILLAFVLWTYGRVSVVSMKLVDCGAFDSGSLFTGQKKKQNNFSQYTIRPKFEQNQVFFPINWMWSKITAAVFADFL